MANIDIGKMADAIMKELEKYADVTTEEMKALAKEVGKRDCREVAEDISKGHGRLCEKVDLSSKSRECQQHYCICA